MQIEANTHAVQSRNATMEPAVERITSVATDRYIAAMAVSPTATQRQSVVSMPKQPGLMSFECVLQVSFGLLFMMYCMLNIV